MPMFKFLFNDIIYPLTEEAIQTILYNCIIERSINIELNGLQTSWLPSESFKGQYNKANITWQLELDLNH